VLTTAMATASAGSTHELHTLCACRLQSSTLPSAALAACDVCIQQRHPGFFAAESVRARLRSTQVVGGRSDWAFSRRRAMGKGRFDCPLLMHGLVANGTIVPFSQSGRHVVCCGSAPTAWEWGVSRSSAVAVADVGHVGRLMLSWLVCCSAGGSCEGTACRARFAAH
jgi:hypothetical protein